MGMRSKHRLGAGVEVDSVSAQLSVSGTQGLSEEPMLQELSLRGPENVESFEESLRSDCIPMHLKLFTLTIKTAVLSIPSSQSSATPAGLASMDEVSVGGSPGQT